MCLTMMFFCLRFDHSTLLFPPIRRCFFSLCFTWSIVRLMREKNFFFKFQVEKKTKVNLTIYRTKKNKFSIY